jgi:alkanesulfonate monooxygenase SsuD/methylene tetrahydromethanopterin reductase-like flavin-dependent oxidoreductase (luciferase family)
VRRAGRADDEYPLVVHVEERPVTDELRVLERRQQVVGRRRAAQHRQVDPLGDGGGGILRQRRRLVDVVQHGGRQDDRADDEGAVFLEVLRGEGFAKPNPRPMFPNPTGLLRVEPYSEGLRERIWWGAGTNATAQWAAKLGMNLQSSTLKIDESGKPFHVQQAEQIRLYRAAWKKAGHARTPRVSVSRSIFALVDDRDRMYFGRGGEDGDQIGMLSETERAIFGRSYAAEPDALIAQLKEDEAIAEADTLLLTVPNQLGVDYNAHVIEAILKHVAPGLGWREGATRTTARDANIP